jgi:type IV secretory pathway VirB10-like protein
MRAGWIVSFIGHVGAVMITLLAWQTSTTFVASSGLTVPVDIVDVAPESNVRATSEDPSMETTPTPAAEEATVETPPAPAPTPAPPAPQPHPRDARAEQNDLLAQAQNLIDRSNRQQQRHSGAQGERNQVGAGLGTAEVASMQDRVRALVRAHMRSCWRMPADLPDPERLVVTLRFSLNRNGTLNGQPSVTSPRSYQFDPPMQQAVQTALRAVRTCDFTFLESDPVVGSHFEIWQQQEYTFSVTQQ